MTSLIEKLAFMPPHPENAQKVLPGKVGFVQSKLGHRISFMDLVPHRPERCITASGERSVPGPCQAWEGALFSPRYTMLYAHMNAEDLSFGAQPLSMLADRLGIRIIAYDYPGYGLSEEVSSSEENAIAAEEAMFLYLTQMVGIPRERLIIAGRSVGGGPSTWLASRQPGLAALILICTFKSIAQVAGSVAGVIGKAIDIFPNIKRLAKVKDTPVLIVHGENDRLVNHEHGKALYKVALQNSTAGAQMITIPGAGHNNLDMKNPQMFFGGIRTFIEGCARRLAQQALTYGNATVPRAPRPPQAGQGLDLPETWTTHAPSCTCPPPKQRQQQQQQQHAAQQQVQQGPVPPQQQQQQMTPQQLQQYAQQQQQMMQGMVPQQQVSQQLKQQQHVVMRNAGHTTAADAAAFALHRAVFASGLGNMPGASGVAPSLAERKRQQQVAAAAGCTPAGVPTQPQQFFVDNTSFGMMQR